MEHTEIRRRLSDFLDNAVSATEKSEIEAHLAACRSCRGALADLERTIAHMKSLPEVEPPPWMTAKIMARVKGGAEPRPALWKRLFFPLYVKLPLEAVALVFLCVTGYYLARTTAPQVPLTDTPTISREDVPKPSAVPAPTQQPSAPAPVSPPAPPAASGAPDVALPPAAERGGYVPPPPTAAPLQSLQPAAPSPPAYPEPMPGSGTAARRSKAEAPQAEMMRDAAPFRESEMMEIRKGAREEMRAFEGLRQPESASDRVPAAVMEKSSPASSAKSRQEPAGEGRGGPVEIALRVNNPAGAVGAIEEAVARARGRIVRRNYGGTTHELLARIEARSVPALVVRLEQVGILLKPPQVTARDEEMVELRISW